MRVIIRLFFRFIRLVLTPVMLLAEKLSTPSPMAHSAEQQQQLSQACQQLALYQFAACPFCIKVRKEMARLGLNIQKRDAQHHAEYRQQLLSGGGKVKVPCLQIKDDSGETQWLYESDAIILHLQSLVTASRS
ncbi:glutathione S-transferase N-terminal domain-containing protein [Alishewanella sp. 16-MA]|uniref:Glutathione S-transferase N-terminal domain-containing protein n=1 Tax=Alishewanella maricola TaxID=2795740 RepID=A0ABS8C547_9ALTE|nr:glutaredoxin domain-containing protein [Alishewanella maricola]MCB5227455.1 glutathione S-transferase N-terminal domain-containing protein [Alishewanella maricola]